MCIRINVTLPTIEKFLLLYSLRNGCKTILVWTLFRSLFCFLFFLTAILELFVRRSFPFGYVLIHKREHLVTDDSFFLVYTSYIALLISEAFLCVHVIYLCTGLFYNDSRLFVPYLTCRFITWIIENIFLLALCITHKSLIGWYLAMMLFVSYIGLAVWPPTYLMLNEDLGQGGWHAKPNGGTGSHMPLPEHTCMCLVADFQLEPVLEFYAFIVVYSYYDEILECERENTCCKDQLDPNVSSIM